MRLYSLNLLNKKWFSLLSNSLTDTMSNSNSNSFLTKSTLLLVSTLTVMAGATIAPSLPAMQEHFQSVNNAALWVRLVLTLPALFIVVGSLIAGIVVDRFGRKPLLLAATALYAGVIHSTRENNLSMS